MGTVSGCAAPEVTASIDSLPVISIIIPGVSVSSHCQSLGYLSVSIKSLPVIPALITRTRTGLVSQFLCLASTTPHPFTRIVRLARPFVSLPPSVRIATVEAARSRLRLGLGTGPLSCVSQGIWGVQVCSRSCRGGVQVQVGQHRGGLKFSQHL